MRRIVSEDHASANQSLKGKGVSTARPHVPNYSAINHHLNQASGSAEISFWDGISRSSGKMLKDQENIQRSVLATQQMSLVEESFSSEQAKFIEENPSGAGLTEFSTKTYGDLVQKASESVNDIDVRQRIEEFGARGIKTVANTSFQKENQMTTAYCLAESQRGLEEKYNQIQSNPGRFESFFEDAKTMINDLIGVIPESQLSQFREQANQNLIMSYGLGLSREDPTQAPDIIRGEFFSKRLSSSNYNKLTRHADLRKKEKQEQNFRDESLVRMQQKQDSTIQKNLIEIGVERGELNLSDIESNNVLTPLHKQQCVLMFERKRREEREQTIAFNKIGEIATTGGDISEISDKHQKAHYEFSCRSQQAQAEAAGNTVTSVDKAVIAAGYTYCNADLRDELKSNMAQSTRHEDRVVAAYAMDFLMKTSPRTLGHVSKEYVNFVNEVTEYVKVDPSNAQAIVDNAAAKYLNEKQLLDNKTVGQVMTQVLRSTSGKIDRFAEAHDFEGRSYSRLWANRTIENKAQFIADYRHELEGSRQ